MYISQQITTLRKEGNLDAAERLASSGFEENMDNKFFQSAYGWVIYFRLKNTKFFGAYREAESGAGQSVILFFVTFSSYFSSYFSVLSSILLRIFQRAKIFFDSFVIFL